jgi:carnitine-CoA ligase
MKDCSAPEARMSIVVGAGNPEAGRPPEDLGSVADLLRRQPQGRAWLRFGNQSYTAAEVVDIAEKLTVHLTELGIGRGGYVGLLMSNRPEFIFWWLAINGAGATAVFLPTVFLEQGLTRYQAYIVPQVIVCERQLGAEAKLDLSGAVSIHDDILLLRQAGATIPSPSVDDLPPPSPADPSCIVFTSGSSGSPKAVVFSHRYVLELGHHVAFGKGMQPGEGLYFSNPLFHGDGIIAVVTTLALRGELHLAERFSVTRFWEDVVRFKSTIFYYVGASLSFLARSPEPTELPAHRLRFGTGGGATEAVADMFEQRFGIPVLDAYSQTECLACCSNTLAARKRGTVGKPYPGIEVRIVDELERPVPIGAVGNIVVRPPRPYMTFSVYLNDPSATVQKTRNLLHHMGDLGFFDEEGFLHFVGRNTPALRRRGENLQPDRIEELAEEISWVKKAAAIGVASEHGDQDILLLLQPYESAPSISQVIEDCRKALPNVMRPRWVEVVASLPMTPSHRLARKELPTKPDAGAVEVEP